MAKGAYMVKGACVVKGVCVAKWGHALQGVYGGMHVGGICGQGVHGGGHAWCGGMHGGRTCMVGQACMVEVSSIVVGGYACQGCAWQGICMAGETASAAHGTHPTGMHSCMNNEF